jgi:single-stranded-DNA-specific exonuclease
VAFKLAAALSGDQDAVLAEYADMVCLGTVADVMPLQGENRVFVTRGLALLKNTKRPGIAALMAQTGCDPDLVSATSIGFMLAPRINAAGRMGQIELAVDLFLTDDAQKASDLASALCDLNRQRQNVESQIYDQAISMLPQGSIPEAIVLADESWHQGVVGIVASRIAEEFCCPTFLICLDGDHGKAS